ncbi:ABC-type hemin transport system ATPase subunit [Streptomyces sp. SAI-135]|uniref:hypothetical protein n=1 Tax=unclassified Streptomyces TaxID=2593676 RepID=UPI0024765988|nr:MULTISPECIES: hypothetical protein [unclassified Streptomyces]MDH6522540.1 ABC-type hemin transport system ATPase subunit [Streptomyces sp. SAI-090]MDH6554161.1 ABC-type hemin transport system ATPase subunit [Streptomyces sp. SAI-041]MDH6573425.1 ABC-type hemin transport system ATPase subunit [Streptomyces sp. SAI-117]MDH6613842.1 ABC-type hemin transport system ATPase subunit [Streptomyces sp. SAI-135]
MVPTASDDDETNAARSQRAPVDAVAVAAVGEQCGRGASPWPATSGLPVQRCQELDDVIADAAGQGHRERNALGVCGRPTSEMDARGKHTTFRELRAMAPDRITVVVTHRLDNVRMAHRVIVLDQGRIREQGSFDELIATEGSQLGELYALAQDR